MWGDHNSSEGLIDGHLAHIISLAIADSLWSALLTNCTSLLSTPEAMERCMAHEAFLQALSQSASWTDTMLRSLRQGLLPQFLLR